MLGIDSTIQFCSEFCRVVLNFLSNISIVANSYAPKNYLYLFFNCQSLVPFYYI